MLCVSSRLTGFYHRYFSHRAFKSGRHHAVHVRLDRLLVGAARPALVGRPSSPSSRAFRRSGRPAFAAAERLSGQPHGLVPDAARRADESQDHSRLRQVSRTALARPLRPRAARRARRFALRLRRLSARGRISAHAAADCWSGVSSSRRLPLPRDVSRQLGHAPHRHAAATRRKTTAATA